MLTPAMPRPHEARTRRWTRYAVVATSPEGENTVIGFTPRPSRAGLLAVLQARGDELIRECGITDEVQVSWATASKKAVARMSNGWIFAVSGSTERDIAYSLGRA